MTPSVIFLVGCVVTALCAAFAVLTTLEMRRIAYETNDGNPLGASDRPLAPSHAASTPAHGRAA